MIEIIIANQTAIVGALSLACFGAYLAWRNGHKNRVAAASGKFRAAILGALNGLYPHPVNWPSDGMAIHQILGAVFPALQAAVAEFSPFVPWWHRRAFNNAWFRYRLGSDGREIDKQCYDQYIAFGSNPDPRGMFKKNVCHLLSFAKET